MHISKLTLVNYRNFANASLTFNKGVNTIIGENGAGKTNVFRAIRLLLDDNMVRQAYRLDETDFHRGLERWQGHWIIISIELQEISTEEEIQALFLHGTGILEEEQVATATYNLIFRPKKNFRQELSELDDGDLDGMNAILGRIGIEDYETVLTGRSEADFTDPTVYSEMVGDFKTATFSEEVDYLGIGTRIPRVLSVTKEVSLTFIQALRDVVSEFQNNRTNPLLSLLKKKSGELNIENFAPIALQIQQLNGSIEALDDVKALRKDIKSTINSAAGKTYSPSSLSIKSELPEKAEKIYQSLKLFIGESADEYEGPIQELSLGGANLIYLTLKLLEFKYQHDRHAIANFLLIEEPEAHLHTHIQKTLFDRIGYAGAQIIYSTHSTHISAVSNVQSVNILARSGGACHAFQPSAGLNSTEIGNIQRYLDAVRSNLLFAKSVLLVEGDAEEILIPLLLKKVLGISLDELGISLVNIGSTGFKNISVLFHDDRIRRRCAIITDLDSAYADTEEQPDDSERTKKWKARMRASAASGESRKEDLDAETADNNWLSVFYATHTFEVDFTQCGNIPELEMTVDDVYSGANTIQEANDDFESEDIARYGRRVLTMATKKGKGWFAILLGKYVDEWTNVPPYILQAVIFAHGEFSTEVMASILRHRLMSYRGDNGRFPRRALRELWNNASEFSRNERSFNAIREEVLEVIPDDPVCDLLRNIP
ncbi:ATP-dependent nuclease [Herbaspirillum frisingense]|uniref:ATP-dependent endonuclease of OLD family n=1 Tax=Herbaspirillum frisingense TaxID=92645 RepID=A0ABU1PG67_9BURK|nr:AAA family ATPase [Herbaspirillum frisingense]MDR6584338.1 putative ATP-dependent endonuclease of OLD family [Herbaspirillum frisingense]